MNDTATENLVVLKYSDDYYDEFTIQALVLTTDLRWDRVKARIADVFPAGTELWVSFGVNQDIKYSCGANFLSKCEVHPVTQAFAKEFARMVGDEEFFDWRNPLLGKDQSEWRLCVIGGMLPTFLLPGDASWPKYNKFKNSGRLCGGWTSWYRELGFVRDSDPLYSALVGK